jgi:uncharacterized protein YndB with AHSA1/START domain
MTETIANRMTLTLVSDTEIAVTRAFDAPRSLVFEASSKCEHLSRWWGPRGFELTGCDIDFRVGGAYRFVQRAPDGTSHAFHGVYREIAAPERTVLTQTYEPVPDQEVVVTTVLAEANGKTLLSQTIVFGSREARDGMVAGGMEWGQRQSFERLDELMSDLQSAAAEAPELHITRDFDAPIDLVWRAWTDPEALAEWWGPAGSQIDVAQMDLRPGGAFLYSMKTGGAPAMWGKFIFREVAPPDRLVFVNTFSDASGGMTRNPWIGTWPLEILNTLTLAEVGGKTRLTIHGGPINATAEELAAFAAGRDGMQKGFAGTFNQLDKYLAQTPARI